MGEGRRREVVFFVFFPTTEKRNDINRNKIEKRKKKVSVLTVLSTVVPAVDEIDG